MKVEGCEKIWSSFSLRNSGVLVFCVNETRREKGYSQREIISPRYDLVLNRRDDQVLEIIGPKWLSFRGRVMADVVDEAWQIEVEELELSDSPPRGFHFASVHGPIISGYGLVAVKDPLVIELRDNNSEVSSTTSSCDISEAD
ncbi:uncharacterized protein PGTG_01462 [Puccinia graminis f. sp. tritici CRL 75-36-700-3]|uniref:Uncharacterized protein n=1 Tax=Puccinia graminis f. sp. tritici (strain CRL 75-36-700-3 / race SCCL) TaxID=418459 RepID=E3JSE4_PUCGT|nr:uncharacterized protein PGTG_01462 [Puccinia graminis f. sp. tritici CRL 75-36-700-3]EFP74869.2 hypothetical protein PGTG_01462 [Puccinia graminis f. sp. tritici CRL 75-36-700-3]